MNFICEPCKDAADTKFGYTIKEVKQIAHEKCKGGTWCDCQHRVTK